jgi:imidazolonepropionase-like amidohydrolase
MNVLRLQLLVLIFLAIASPASAKTTALRGGTVHTVSGDIIESATLLFDETKIREIGKHVEVPADATVINCAGQHIYPGLIVAYSQIGLVEVRAVRATVDTEEGGPFNPNALVHKAFNADSEIIPVTRSNGVLLALVAPSGGLLSGQSSLMRMSGWTWEEMLFQPGVGMHCQWPGGSSSSDQLRQFTELLSNARAYRRARQENPGGTSFDIRLEAMQPLIERKQPLVVDADYLSDIEAAVAYAEWQKLRLVIVGGYDAPLCADLLKKHEVPVIISAVYRLPLRRSDAYDASYTLPARLHAAGVKFAIACNVQSAYNVRNLPYNAATAAAYGLPADEALKSITLYPAQILGVADRVGSLEAGKEATLFIASGDPLETSTRVVAAYMAGKPIDLDDRHKRLYDKFRARVEGTSTAKDPKGP